VIILLRLAGIGRSDYVACQLDHDPVVDNKSKFWIFLGNVQAAGLMQVTVIEN
jgi:hypothetical protein